MKNKLGQNNPKILKLEELREALRNKGDKVSKAKRIMSLLEVQKGLIRRKFRMTDFKEPCLFFARRNGDLEFYEDVTAGKFVYDHSDGNPRFLQIRASDQRTFDFFGHKVRCYVGHEDRPFCDWDVPINDSESVALGYEKTKATDLKYQEKIENLRQKGKLTWVWIIVGLAFAIGIVMFAWATWVAPAQAQKVVQTGSTAPPVSGIVILALSKWRNKFLRRKNG